MRKLVDYKIVCGSHVEEVEKSIRDYIGGGWELLGPAYCCQDRHCQTIVTYEVSESEIPSTPSSPRGETGFLMVSSYQVAQSLGFKGDYRAWEHLLRIHE